MLKAEKIESKEAVAILESLEKVENYIQSAFRSGAWGYKNLLRFARSPGGKILKFANK